MHWSPSLPLPVVLFIPFMDGNLFLLWLCLLLIQEWTVAQKWTCWNSHFPVLLSSPGKRFQLEQGGVRYQSLLKSQKVIAQLRWCNSDLNGSAIWFNVKQLRIIIILPGVYLFNYIFHMREGHGRMHAFLCCLQTRQCSDLDLISFSMAKLFQHKTTTLTSKHFAFSCLFLHYI